mgnify:CR=1 FL=1
MKYNLKSLLIFFTAIFLYSCSTGRPSFADNPPVKKGYIYAVGVGSQPLEADAMMEAQTLARQQISAEIQAKTDGNMKRVSSSVNSANAVSGYETLLKESYSQSLSGAKTVKRHVFKESDNYKAYVLMQVNEKEAQKNLLARIKAKKELNDALRVTDLYKELEKEFGSNN